MLRHRLVFIRHGETDWNFEGRLQGQQDIPLNERGRAQAAQAGKTVAKMFAPERLATGLRFVASPLGRARETMELARLAMGLPRDGYALDDRLKELTFGQWEGLTWPQVKARAPEAASWREGDKWNFTPPSGESYAMLAERLQPWLDGLEGETLVVSHGGVARALMAVIGALPRERAALADIWQGRVIVFEGGRYKWV